jgi:chromosome segregation ATPase
MERALLDMVEQMNLAALARDKALDAKIEALTQQLQQQEESVTTLNSLLRPFLPKG